MHRASLRLNLTAPLLLLSSIALGAPASRMKTITVSEGTDMQVTVSPDHKTILADIQGLIFSIPFSGGAAKQLTQPMQEASHPDWSSKGDLIALQCYAGGTFHIWTMRPDGTGLKQVTTGHGDDREPRISPDGTTIAFASDRAFKGSYDIWTIRIDGTGLKQITSSPADEYEPNWSPDGKRLAFVSGTGIRSCNGQDHTARPFHLLPRTRSLLTQRKNRRHRHEQSLYQAISRRHQRHPHRRPRNEGYEVLPAGALRVSHHTHRGRPRLCS